MALVLVQHQAITWANEDLLLIGPWELQWDVAQYNTVVSRHHGDNLITGYIPKSVILMTFVVANNSMIVSHHYNNQ